MLKVWCKKREEDVALPLVMQTSLGKASAQEHHLEKRKWLSFQSEGMQLWAFTIRNKTIPQNVTSAKHLFLWIHVTMPQKMIDSDAITSPYLLAKPLLRWLHRRTSHPQRCDVAGSAMPREHAFFIVVKVPFKFNIPPEEKSANPPQEENYNSNSCSFNHFF